MSNNGKDIGVQVMVPQDADPVTKAQAIVLGYLMREFFAVGPQSGLSPKQAFVAALAFPAVAAKALERMSSDMPTTEGGKDEVEAEAQRLVDQFESIEVIAQ
ncbi:hypothetical protein [Nostoc phage Nsp-JY18]